jgi:hypothetical protein
MKNTLKILCLLLSINAFAGFESPIEGTVSNLSTPNSHYVLDEIIMRGQTPRNLSEYSELKNLGVQSVLIFKNETKNEVQDEIKVLNNLKITSKHIVFPWKDITEFSPVCENAKLALSFLSNNFTKNKKTYFHCTVGEDRTGLLAGLLINIYNPNLTIKSIFKSEMCERGYEAGDVKKDQKVVKLVRENLTPVFLKMAYLIKLSDRNINAIDCDYDFSSDKNFQKSFYNRPTALNCTK